MNFQAYMMALNPETAAQVGSFYGYPQGGNAYSQINPYAYSDLGRDENPADKLYADMFRAQTQDYMNRFAPVENDLISRITPTGTTSLAGDLERTQQAVLGCGDECTGAAEPLYGAFRSVREQFYRQWERHCGCPCRRSQ